MNNIEDSLIVSFDFNSSKDAATMIVARNNGGRIKFLNAIFGDEAKDIYNKLVEDSER